MRVLGLLSLLLSAVPAAVSQKTDNPGRGMLGFALGNKNPDGSCKAVDDYKADFDALKSISTLVRIYSASNCDAAKNILPAAKDKGFKVVLGVWYDATSGIRFAGVGTNIVSVTGPTMMSRSTRTSMSSSRLCLGTRKSSVRLPSALNVFTGVP